MFPLLLLGAVVLIAAHSAKARTLWKSAFSTSDFKDLTSEAEGAFARFAGVESLPSFTTDGLDKLRAKLERQPADLGAPLSIETLATGHNVAFYELAPGGSEKLEDGALVQICQALEFAEESYGGGAALFISPTKIDTDETDWVGGFAITTGPADDADLAPGGLLEGCVRAGSLAELRAAGFCPKEAA